LKLKFVFAALIIWPQFVFAAGADCTMTPAPIDFKRIAHQPLIKSYTLSTSKLELSALLKNGYTAKLTHMGCADSGGILSVWLESGDVSNEDKWINEAVKFSKIFFSPYVFNFIEKSIANKKYRKELDANRLVINGSSNEIFSYSIVVTPVEQGIILSIDYNFAG
jgi:hypothetical protein